MSQGKIISAVKVQKDFQKIQGKCITVDDAIKICQNNPFLLPIEGNNDKFKMKSADEIGKIMAEMEKASEEKEDDSLQD